LPFFLIPVYLFSLAASIRVQGVPCESNPLLLENPVPTEWYTYVTRKNDSGTGVNPTNYICGKRYFLSS